MVLAVCAVSYLGKPPPSCSERKEKKKTTTTTKEMADSEITAVIGYLGCYRVSRNTQFPEDVARGRGRERRKT